MRLAGLLMLAVVAAACGRTSEAEAPAQTAATTPNAIPVTTAPAAARDVERTVSVVGTLAANEQTELASEAEGQVMSIDADLGDRVKKGQILAAVRSDVLEAQCREADANLAKAAADEHRAKPLRDQGIISPQEYEKVRTEAEVEKARRDRLRIQLERASIRAPFDGSVSARLVNLGDYVRAGSVTFRLVQDDPLKFRGEVPERDVPALQAGQEVRISVDPYPGETFVGHLSRVGSASDPTARALAFEALVPNADHRIRPGFFGHGDVVVRHDEHAVAVPRSAITTFAGVTKVFVVDGGVAREKPVTVGVDLGDGWVEILQGITRGQVVVTSGLSRVTDGALVAVRDEASPGA
jgi:membrane fusion protein (multidrug efflux system)